MLRDEKTIFFATGYPRSGNTLFAHILKGLYPQTQFITHSHTVAALKIALSYEKKTIVLFRDPESSVSSMLLKGKHGKEKHRMGFKQLQKRINFEWYLKEYISYYSFVLENKDKLMPIKAEYLFNSPVDTLRNVERYLNIIGKDKNHSNLSELVTNRINSYNEKRIKHDEENEFASGLPSSEKNKVKNQIIRDIKSHKEYRDARWIYDSLAEGI